MVTGGRVRTWVRERRNNGEEDIKVGRYVGWKKRERRENERNGGTAAEETFPERSEAAQQERTLHRSTTVTAGAPSTEAIGFPQRSSTLTRTPVPHVVPFSTTSASPLAPVAPDMTVRRSGAPARSVREKVKLTAAPPLTIHTCASQSNCTAQRSHGDSQEVAGNRERAAPSLSGPRPIISSSNKHRERKTTPRPCVVESGARSEPRHGQSYEGRAERRPWQGPMPRRHQRSPCRTPSRARIEEIGLNRPFFLTQRRHGPPAKLIISIGFSAVVPTDRSQEATFMYAPCGTAAPWRKHTLPLASVDS